MVNDSFGLIPSGLKTSGLATAHCTLPTTH